MGFFDAIVQPALQAVASVAAPPLGAAMAQGQQNQAQWDLTQSTNQASQASADKQMAFQHQETSTAHQREVQDLAKAGLNPLHSSAGSGASSGGGASATMQTPQYGSPLGAGIQKGFDMVKSLGDVMTQVSAMQQSNAQTKLINAQTQKVGVDTKVAEKGIPASDLANKFYNGIVSPTLNYVKERFQSTPQQRSQKAIDDFKRMTNQPVQIRGGLR